jgi:hypothetical protein
MKERELKFNHSDDHTIVEFNKKESEKFNKSWKDLAFMLSTMKKDVEEGTLTVQMREAYSSLLEIHSKDILDVFKYDGVLQKEKEERHAEIRNLNTENHELRKQLGEKVSMEDIRESLKNISEQIRRWWNIEGFGHTSEIDFGPYGANVKFSGMITDTYYDIDKDLTEEDKIKQLQEYGFELTIGNGRRDTKVKMTPDNVGLLEKLLLSRFPSADIYNIKTHFHKKVSQSEIREIEVFIRNFEDFKTN